MYGEKNTLISFRCIDLLWKPIGQIVRFVIVIHPSRGKCIFMTTDLSLDPIQIIPLYGLRFKIEVSFKQSVRTIGAYFYHFWMMNMIPSKRNQGNQYLHKKSEKYRNQIKRKINAYHIFVFSGIVAQGMLQYLAATFPKLVWNSFGSWIRNIRPGVPPSEMITSMALRNNYFEFLLANHNELIWPKFIHEILDPNRFQRLGIAA